MPTLLPADSKESCDDSVVVAVRSTPELSVSGVCHWEIPAVGWTGARMRSISFFGWLWFGIDLGWINVMLAGFNDDKSLDMRRVRLTARRNKSTLV